MSHKRTTRRVINLFQVFRVQEWAYTLLFLLVMEIFILSVVDSRQINSWKFIINILYIIILYSYGFIINSYADRKDDHMVGKKVYLYLFNKSIIVSLIVISGILLFFIPFIFKSISIIFLGVIIFFLATFYSLKPIRLKERGLVGFLLLILTGLPLPFLFFVLIFDISCIHAMLFFGLLFLFSFVNEISHLVDDYNCDKRINTKTWALRIGKTRTKQIYKISLYLLGSYPLIFFFYYPIILSAVFLSIIQLLLVNLYEDYQEFKDI